ncbi:MAG: bis(5'-nucleosyl)-tetraphosphatase (symmetrical) YqeK [Clostridia bacterium]|nr:bis(5'-nucleosyl)-tetraphosphatase (symmetrical) YqeK [Clostridia bacterium]
MYLIGGDSVKHFDTWKKPEEVVKVCPIAVVARGGFDSIHDDIDRLTSKFGGEFILLSCVGEDISSSSLKTCLLLGEDVESLPRAVLDEIREKHLFEEYKPWLEKLKGYQTDELFEHSKAVVKRAIEFNSKHNLKQDFEKVFTAALLHDNAKQRPSLDGLDVPSDCVGTPVLHQFLGAEKARRDFGVDDSEVLEAIRCHTTAKAAMTTFEKLIYTADSLSDDRDYAPIPELRSIAIADFEKGFRATLEYTYEKLRAKGGAIYPLTVAAYEYYIVNGNI